MQESLQFSGYFNGKSSITHKTVALTFGVSFACHAVLIGVLFFLPGYSRPMLTPFPSAINVSLVSLPAGRPGPPLGKPDVKKSAAIVEKKIAKQVPAKVEKPKEISKPAVNAVKKVQQEPVKKVSKAISLKPKISPKEKIDSAELIKNAVKDMEKRVEESRPSSVSDAISKIKNQINSTENATKIDEINKTKGFGFQEGTLNGGSPGIAGGSGGNNLPIGVFDIYKAEIFYIIQQNWAYSEQIGGRGLDEMAVLVIKIMSNGEISNIRYESRSKNRYLDESAYRAIQKSNPLPPLPEGFSRPYYEVGLRFGTSGLKRD